MPKVAAFQQTRSFPRQNQTDRYTLDLDLAFEQQQFHTESKAAFDGRSQVVASRLYDRNSIDRFENRSYATSVFRTATETHSTDESREAALHLSPLKFSSSDDRIAPPAAVQRYVSQLHTERTESHGRRHLPIRPRTLHDSGSDHHVRFSGAAEIREFDPQAPPTPAQDRKHQRAAFEDRVPQKRHLLEDAFFRLDHHVKQ
jgi:hypothetical protein